MRIANYDLAENSFPKDDLENKGTEFLQQTLVFKSLYL